MLRLTPSGEFQPNTEEEEEVKKWIDALQRDSSAASECAEHGNNVTENIGNDELRLSGMKIH